MRFMFSFMPGQTSYTPRSNQLDAPGFIDAAAQAHHVFHNNPPPFSTEPPDRIVLTLCEPPFGGRVFDFNTFEEVA
jgi:hypothetical protein